MSFFESLWNSISPHASLCVLMGPYRSLFVLMDFNGSLLVLISLFLLLWILSRPYVSF